jgi:hypothetical protein
MCDVSLFFIYNCPALSVVVPYMCVVSLFFFIYCRVVCRICVASVAVSYMCVVSLFFFIYCRGTFSLSESGRSQTSKSSRNCNGTYTWHTFVILFLMCECYVASFDWLKKWKTTNKKTSRRCVVLFFYLLFFNNLFISYTHSRELISLLASEK